MRPETFLEAYATESLKIMARRRGLADAAGLAKAGLIAFLAPRLFSREANRRLVQSLPGRQRRLLAALRARGSEADTVALAAAVEGEAGTIAGDIQDLVEMGLLLYPREGRGRKYRLGQCERVWMDRTTADAVEPVAATGPTPKLLSGPPAVVRAAAAGRLAVDLVLLLHRLEERPVAPPRQGEPGEEAWTELARSLAAPSGGDVPHGYPRFLFLLLEESGLLKVRGGRLVPADQAGSFFHQEAGARLRTLCNAWSGTTAYDEFARIPELVPRPAPETSLADQVPSPGRVARARARVLSALRRFDPGRWYAFSSLRREIKSTHPDFLVRRGGPGGRALNTYRGIGERGRGGAALPLDLTSDWDKVEGRFIARLLLEPLHWLGGVDLGFDSEPEAGASHLDAFRITDAGAYLLGLSAALPGPGPSRPPLALESDFSLLVLDPAADPGLLHDLSRFASLQGGDQVIRFALTRDAARRGFHAGWDRAGILARLESASLGPVPQNVAASLAEWERAFRSFRIVTGVRLLEDAGDALPGPDEDPALHAILGEPLAPGIWRLGEAGPRRLRPLLRRARVAVETFDYDVPPGHGLDLMPDLTIIRHPRGGDWLTTAMLERIAVADPAGGDTWRLEPKRVRATVRGGIGPDEIVRFLEARSRQSSPELRLAVTAWSRRRPGAALGRHTLLVCEDAGLRELILDVPELAACLGERLADAVFRVVPGQARTLRAALGRLGVSLAAAGGPQLLKERPSSDRGQATETSRALLPFRWSRAHRGHGGESGGGEKLSFLLSRAAATRRRVRLEYALRAGGRTVRRELSPLGVTGGLLSAYCPATGRERSYPLDRILSVELLPARD